MIAASGFLTASECTKFVFGRGSAPVPVGGAYSASTDSLACLRGLLLKRKGREGIVAKGEEGKGNDGPPYANP